MFGAIIGGMVGSIFGLYSIKTKEFDIYSNRTEMTALLTNVIA